MLALIAVSILWAFSFGLIKGQLTGIDSTLVATIRLLLCALIFLPWLKAPLYTTKRFQLMALGAIQFGVMYLAYIQAYQYLPGYLVAVFTILTPLYVMIFSALFNRQLSLTKLMPVLLSIIGAAVIVYRAPNAEKWLIGFLILQLANIAFAFGQVSYQQLGMRLSSTHKESKSTHVENMAFMFLGAALLTSAISLINGSFAEVVDITKSQWLVLLYLGVIASGFGFCLWNYGALGVSDSHLAIMNNGYIPLAVIFSLTIFGESAELSKLAIGGVIIVVSLLWSEKLSKR